MESWCEMDSSSDKFFTCIGKWSTLLNVDCSNLSNCVNFQSTAGERNSGLFYFIHYLPVNIKKSGDS